MTTTYKLLLSSRLHDSGAFAADVEQRIGFDSRFLCCLLLATDLFPVSST